jgi:thioredoxin 1
MKKLLFVLMSMLAITTTCVVAASPNYNEAVKDYNEGHYARALSQFESLKASYPNNALVRYYSGLCYQATGKYSTAKSEFEYVATCKDARLSAMAKSGIDQLSKAHPSSLQGSHSPVLFGLSATNAGRAGSGSSSGSSGSGPGKVKKVLDFYADWCGPCKAFGPTFEEVQASMHGIQFERHNIDDPDGKELSAKYPFPTIPHVVFLDDHGNVAFSGSPQRSFDAFKAQIESFNK